MLVETRQSSFIYNILHLVSQSLLSQLKNQD